MSNSENRVTLNRREALFLAAAGGIGAALARPAYASDSTKTGVHQEPGFCSTPKSPSPTPSTARCADLSLETFSPSRASHTARTPAVKIAGSGQALPCRGLAEYPALIYGGNCPQSLHNWTGLEQSFLQDWDDGYKARICSS